MQENQEKFIKLVNEKVFNKDLKYSILTMGCQLNENDSEKISGMLEKMGFSEIEDYKNADLVIFNTCCVRENAEERLFGKIGEIKKIKENRNVILAIGGCMMQEEGMLQKIKKSYPFVNVIFGTHTMQNLPEDIYKAIINNEKVKDVIDIDGEIYEGLPIKRNDKFKASVTIMYGCNNFCTYCIVPYVRGRERSREPEKILEEVKELAKEGYKEITLLGQNVNSYVGNDKIKNFADLLNEVCKISGIERIRFISPHPKDFTDDVIDAIANNEKICKIIHLPLQSGNTKVLNAMNRRYSKEQYLELVEKMKKRIPNVVLSTDIIVGFPEETDEEFEDTLDVVRKVNFEQIFMFIYSVREGTVAEKMKQVPEEKKHERFERLKELYDSRVDENNEKYLNTVQKLLIEGKSKNNEKMFEGRTDTNKVVIFKPNDENKIGDIVSVKIIETHKWYLKGEIIKKKKKEELKKFLEELKYEESSIGDILELVDNESDIKSLYEKMDFLTKIGVTPEGIDIILSDNPLFLTTDLETVKRSVNFLKNIKLENISKIIEINSELLSTQDKIMSENYKLLRVLMPEKEVLNMLKIDSEILSFNTDYLEKRFEFFIKNGLKDKIKTIILNKIEAFEDDEEDIDLEELKGM